MLALRAAIGRKALAGDGETIGQVRGKDAGIAEPLSRGLAGEAVEVDAKPGGIERHEALGEQRADRPGQHVAGPAARKGGVLEGRDRDLALRRRR